jgi:pyruvate-formate lyase-activating enzyme
MMDLASRLQPANTGICISQEGAVACIEGLQQPWAYAAYLPLEGSGRLIINARARLRSGSMSVGVLTKDESSYVIERPIPRTNEFVDVPITVDDGGACGKLVFRTYDNADNPPILELESITIEIGQSTNPITNRPKFEPIDPIVENLWPLDTATFNVNDMRRWTPADLQNYLTGDAWQDNLILNKYEFAIGQSELKSFPWRFSVPFVLCNARCEFCSAWLVQGEPMPIDLLDRLEVVLPYLVQIDMVGWGEPLIHPQFGEVLARFRDRADRRARIALTTNGVHLKKWADRLIEANVKEYAISIHASTPATHEDLMGLPPDSFDSIIDGIGAVTARKATVPGLKLGLVFIVTRQNLEEIPAFIAMAHDVGADSVFIRTLKSRTAKEQRSDGLDYHRLPPYLHPDFENLRARAVEAIANSPIQVQAAPETWSTNIFPHDDEAALLAEPLTPRKVRLASKTIRRTPAPDTEALPVGEPLTSDSPNPYHHSYGDPDSEISNDLLDNPYHRNAPLLCPSPYTALYINGFDRMATPCCYMTQVPGYNFTFLRKGASFGQVWNSPAMVGLRQSLNDGPLKAPCKKCAFYW